LRVCIKDTGFGLSADKIARLFTPFDRLGAELTGVEGTGIGLAYSKRMVTAMGGTLGLESIVGTGSTFWVDLPLAESPFCSNPSQRRA
jgi:two-component system, sensor histidine kinase